MKEKNKEGLQTRYYIQKIKMMPNPNFSPTVKVSQVINNHDSFIETLVPVDKNAKYFVLRLDEVASDMEHIKACRIAAHAYADAIQNHLPALAKDLRSKYPLL